MTCRPNGPRKQQQIGIKNSGKVSSNCQPNKITGATGKNSKITRNENLGYYIMCHLLWLLHVYTSEKHHTSDSKEFQNDDQSIKFSISIYITSTLNSWSIMSIYLTIILKCIWITLYDTFFSYTHVGVMTNGTEQPNHQF